jgi:hypothetical protein
MKLSDFKFDASLAKEGVWVEIGEGASIKVAKLGHPDHRKLVNDLRKPYRSYELAKRELPDNVIREISSKSTAREILRDWKGITDDSGKEIPFSYDAALEALKIDAFAAMVLGFAGDDSLFRETSVEEDSKNLQTSSSGKSDSVEEA